MKNLWIIVLYLLVPALLRKTNLQTNRKFSLYLEWFLETELRCQEVCAHSGFYF
jgi:hypothetical protein